MDFPWVFHGFFHGFCRISSADFADFFEVFIDTDLSKAQRLALFGILASSIFSWWFIMIYIVGIHRILMESNGIFMGFIWFIWDFVWINCNDLTVMMVNKENHPTIASIQVSDWLSVIQIIFDNFSVGIYSSWWWWTRFLFGSSLTIDVHCHVRGTYIRWVFWSKEQTGNTIHGQRLNISKALKQCAHLGDVNFV